MSALLLTSMGLLISTCIKLGSGGFSRYHFIISLDLIWILCLSAMSNTLVLIAMERAAPILELEVTDYSHVSRRRPKSSDHILMPFRATLDRIAITLCLVALGDLELFVNSMALVCVNSTVVWTFGRVLPATSDTVQLLGIARSYFTYFPILLYALPTFVRISRVCNPGRLLPQARPRTREVDWPPFFLRQSSASLFLGLASICAGLSLSTIVSTEKTIAANNVAEGESAWGFGQILAMLLVVAPVREALSTAWGVFSLWRHPKPEQEFDLRLLPTANV